MIVPSVELSPDRISIACGTDENYAIGLAVTLHSALSNTRSNDVDVYVVNGGLSTSTRQRLELLIRRHGRRARLFWLTPDMASLKDVRVYSYLTKASYFRLLLPELLPHLDRVIYLDSDLVVDGDLADVWRRSTDHLLGSAVQDCCLPTVGTALGALCERLGLVPDLPYCNAGIMVMNLRRWRSDALSARALQVLAAHSEHLPFLDQDAVNIVVAGQWDLLPQTWNVMTVGVQYSRMKLPMSPEEMIRRAKVLHYTAARKPWHATYRTAGAGRYARYLRTSGWLDGVARWKWLLYVRAPQFALYALATVKRRVTGKR